MTAGVAAAPGAAPQSVGGELAGRLEGVRGLAGQPGEIEDRMG